MQDSTATRISPTFSAGYSFFRGITLSGFPLSRLCCNSPKPSFRTSTASRGENRNPVKSQYNQISPGSRLASAGGLGRDDDLRHSLSCGNDKRKISFCFRVIQLTQPILLSPLDRNDTILSHFLVL